MEKRDQLFDIFLPMGKTIDIHEVFAVLIVCSKTFGSKKLRLL